MKDGDDDKIASLSVKRYEEVAEFTPIKEVILLPISMWLMM